MISLKSENSGTLKRLIIYMKTEKLYEYINKINIFTELLPLYPLLDIYDPYFFQDILFYHLPITGTRSLFLD